MEGCTLRAYMDCLAAKPSWRWSGRVMRASLQVVESEGPFCSVGDCCEIVDQQGRRHQAEVIGFRNTHVVSMPLARPDGVRFGDAVISHGETPRLGVGEMMLGRVVDAMGYPIDGGEAPRIQQWVPLQRRGPAAMERPLICDVLETGVRVIDTMLTTGRGQRVGLFGGSGVGKSTLIGMMTRGTKADVTVVGLIGERGREVQEFIRDSLGEVGLQRSVTVVSTADDSPLMRMRAAHTATSIAEYFASQGKDVLLVLDSLTRYAMAAREVGVAVGEPQTSKGYTPSVFAQLAHLVERVGRFSKGSITAFYTVLMEGDDQQDPVADSVRSLLDGHIILSRQLASQGIYPPIHVLDSLSRLMPAVASKEHQRLAGEVRKILGAYAHAEDMIRIGVYKAGSDPSIDRALRHHATLMHVFQQNAEDVSFLDASLHQLLSLDLS